MIYKFKRLLLALFLFLLVFVTIKEIAYGFIAYSQSTWVVQWFGNFYESKISINDKKAIGKDSCNAEQINLLINEDIIINHNYIIDSLWNNKTIEVKLKRLRHIIHLFYPNLISGYDPYLEIIMPKMDYDECKIVHENKKIHAEVKLTGGQLDHFNTSRRSLRVKSEKKIFNMNVFNLYHPKVRLGGIYEWLGHMLLENEGLIALKTGYLNVSINNKKKGLYFFQEHPSSNMLKNNHLSPGLLFRLCLRDSIGNRVTNYEENNTKLTIEKYYDKSTLKTTIDFKKQKLILEKLLERFNKNEISFDSLMSIKKLSKFSAIINLINGYHGAVLGNCYFYLNPETLLIEPIGREFATNFYEPSWELKFRSPYYLKEKSMKKDHVLSVLYPYGLDSVKLKNYEKFFIGDLKRISKKSYLDTIFSLYSEELLQRQYCLYEGDQSFKKFNPNLYYKNQKSIQNYIETINSE